MRFHSLRRNGGFVLRPQLHKYGKCFTRYTDIHWLWFVMEFNDDR